MTGVECAFLREETLWESDRETVLEQIYSHIEKLLAQAGISENQLLAIGCGLAGGIDFEHSVVKDAANFRDFDGVPLGKLIRQRFNAPCFLANSIIVRLLGESVSNAVINEKNIAYISLGTGIGAGIIFQSKVLVPTKNEKIGDIAHFMVEKDGPKCNCGLHGCLEALVGARRLMAKIKTQLPESNSMLKNDIESLDWEAVAHAAENNDELVCRILKEAGRYIGMALCGVIQFHRPEIIVLGGGMTNLGDCLINAIKDEIAGNLPKERFDVDNIVISDQIYRSGAIGATMYAWDNIFHSEREYVNLKLQGTMDN
jgi:glucokinase